MKKTTFPTKKQVSAVTQRSRDQSVREKVDLGALFLTDDRMNQGGEKAFPGPHSECLDLQEWHLSGISMFECGHCPQITLEVGEKREHGHPFAVIRRDSQLQECSLLGLTGSHHLLWDPRMLETSCLEMSWKHLVGSVLLSEPEILPMPMSW